MGVRDRKQGRVQDPQGGTLRWGSECVSAFEGQGMGATMAGVGAVMAGSGACHEGIGESASGRQSGGGCWGRDCVCRRPFQGSLGRGIWQLKM